MTTETQPQTRQEQPDDANNIWRILGRLEANQQTMLHRMNQQDTRMDRLEAKIDRLLYLMIGVGGATIATLVGVFMS